MTLTAILWDMDGTLIDSEPAHDQAFHAAVEALGLAVPPDAHDAMLGCSSVEVHQMLVELTGTALTLPAWQRIKWQHYQQLSAGIKPMKYARAILDTCQAKGIAMALVSNSTRDEVELNLKVTGLADYFQITLSRDEVAQGKPAPDGYLAAAQALSAPIAECLVIEDSVTGAQAGLAAGMTTVFHPETAALVANCPEGALLLPPAENLAVWLENYIGS